MPTPGNRYRYLGDVIRPARAPTQELFTSLTDTRNEIGLRYRCGTGIAYTFDYDEPGMSIDLDSVHESDVPDTPEPGTVVYLRKVHRDGRVEPQPHYLVTLNERGGTSSVRLKEGIFPR